MRGNEKRGDHGTLSQVFVDRVDDGGDGGGG